MSLRPASLAILAALTLAPLAAAAAPDHTVAVEHVSAAPAPVPATSDDAGNYARREATSHSAQDFRGGSVVLVISGGAALVLIVLLVVLLV